MDVQFAGENLLAGQIGHLLIILSFVTSLLALVSYYFSTEITNSLVPTDASPGWLAKGNSWLSLGNLFFVFHAGAVFIAIAILFYLIFGHYFEYDYVRQHSSVDMPTHYLVSSFWSGQQGSFLLWIFWHAVLGLILIPFTAQKWKAPVMAVLALVQVILTSMLLGLYIPRGIPLILILVILLLPVSLTLKQRGRMDWQGMVPGWNFVAVAKTEAGKVAKGVMYFFAFLAIGFIAIVIYPFDYLTEIIRIGVSPFVLTRHEFSGSEVFLFADYLEQIVGKGLNPLLQNIWMVIHPPTLFMGFALTIVPFAFAIAGFWRRDYGSWTKPALPWTIVAASVLGTGIMMGGMWAYEALSFGGFWAWDPVENASFVPWLFLIAGLHTLLAYKSTGHSLKWTYIFFAIAYFLILYSTFLTRSGILGESSVHSFTDLGMMGQLLILIVIMMIPAVVLGVLRFKDISSPKKEESSYSREFWLFIGSLVLVISAIQITFSTSIPVYNAISSGINNLLNTDIKDNFAPPENAVSYYNSIQVWLGIAIAFLSGAVQYLKYRQTDIKRFLNQLMPIILVSLILTALLEYFFHLRSLAYMLLLFTGIFAVLANLQYMLFVLKSNIKLSGASVAHIGFGLVMVGIIISLSEQQVISKNEARLDFGSNFDEDFKQNNIYLLRGKTYPMDDYLVSYQGRRNEGNDFYYDVAYYRINKYGDTSESFVLSPHILMHPEMGATPNPATKKYPHRDVFTHINAIPMDKDRQPVNLPQVSIEKVGIGDSFFTSPGMVRFDGIQRVGEIESGIAAIAQLSINTIDSVYYAEPMFIVSQNGIETEPAVLENLNMQIELQNIDPQAGVFTFRITDNNDWIIMKAILFPYINILWIGITITMIGFMLAMFRRIKEYNRIKSREIV